MPTTPAPTPASDITFDGGSLVVTSGLYDTEDGIKLKVAGDVEPRVHITPQGSVKTGDGTTAPTAISGVGLVSAFPVPIVDDVCDLAAAIAAGYSTVQTTVTDETDVEIVMPDPATTPEWAWLRVDPTGACNFTYSGGAVSALLDDVNLDDGDPALTFFFQMTHYYTGGAPKWTAVPRFGAAQLGVYTPADSDVWDGDPETISEALDRIAAVVGDTVPIP